MFSIHGAEVEGGPTVGRLVLPSGELVLFDAADRVLVDQYVWYAVPGARTIYAYGYLRGHAPSLGRKRIGMHRLLLLDAPVGVEVDHRNGDGLDNRRLNLRLGTHAQNNANRLPFHGDYKGVSRYRDGRRWRAYINVDGKHCHLGLFDDRWEAAQAYDAAAIEAWGEFARLNERVAS